MRKLESWRKNEGVGLQKLYTADEQYLKVESLGKGEKNLAKLREMHLDLQLLDLLFISWWTGGRMVSV